MKDILSATPDPSCIKDPATIASSSCEISSTAEQAGQPITSGGGSS